MRFDWIKRLQRVPQMWGSISVQKQLLLLGLISISALVTFTAWVLVNRTQAVINHSVEQFGMALAQALSRGGAEALSNAGNLEGLKYYVMTEMGQTPAIAYIAFADPNGKVLLDSRAFPDRKGESSKIYPIYLQYKQTAQGVFPSPPGYRPIMNFAVPMRRNNEDLGVCWVGLDSYAFTILGTPKETRYFLVSIFALVWFLGALCLAVNYALINRPLKALSEGASHIATGRFGHQVASQRAGKEIDQVVNAFNYMSNRLQQYDKQNIETLMAERNKFISEKNKLELVLMSIADGVVVCDRDNKVQIVNAAATFLFDKDAKELLGKPLVVCTGGPDSPQICQVIQAFTDTISPGGQETESMIQQIHLGERTVRLHIAPIILNKEFLGSVMIMQDITRQAELERLKNEFISNVSHELRTPITSIKSYVDTLCNHGDRLDAQTHTEFLETIDNEADRLMYLVNEVLELSKLEEGDKDLDMAPQSIRLAVDQAVRSVNLLAREREIEVSVRDEEDPPAIIMNQESIERCIINLMTNAIKYTPVGGKIVVSIHYMRESNEVGVDVTDNGIGIPEDCLDQIFDRFYRVEQKVHTIKGTGLGLTIVKKIIEKHGGRVAATSAIGEGSTFSFFLPVAEQHAQPDSPITANETTSEVARATFTL
jgi:two-component system, OmpR family, sensor histidine kinase NblS